MHTLNDPAEHRRVLAVLDDYNRLTDAGRHGFRVLAGLKHKTRRLADLVELYEDADDDDRDRLERFTDDSAAADGPQDRRPDQMGHRTS